MTPLTQFDGRRRTRTCDLVVGLDFGTSCTKVVVRSPYERDRAFAVPFAEAAHHSSPYLLPSVLWIDPDGAASLTRVADAFCLRDVKYHLMQSTSIPAIHGGVGERTFQAPTVAVAFLALTLRAIRGWFLDTYRAGYGGFKLDWQFNLGLPSADFAEEPLCHNYLRIAAAAWKLSVQKSRIDLARAESAHRAVRVKEDESVNSVGALVDCGEGRSAQVSLVPEVVAEVVGYARSHQRDEGLHILMDIGVCTMDVCSFILHEKEGDDHYELLTADVRGLGAMVLHRDRIEVIRQSVSAQTLSELVDWDPVEPIPDPIEQHMSPEPEPELLDRLQDSDLKYRRKCSRMIWQTLVALKVSRDPRSPRWNSEMPMFVAGGAKDMRFYEKTIATVSNEVEEMYPPCRGVLPLALTKPDNLEADINDNGYHRLAVAWGLSYPETDIGKVTRPCDIEDVPPRRRAKPLRPFVSKDMV